MSLLSIAGSTPSDSGFELKSARFDEDRATKLARTFTSTGNRKTWTVSTWVKLGTQVDTTDHGEIFNGHTSNDNNGFTAIYFYNGQVGVAGWSGGGWKWTTREFRDPSAWYHLVFVFDTTQGVATDRCKIYVNGERVTAWATDNALTQNGDYGIGGAWLHQIGHDNSASSGRAFSGYMAEFYYADGQALGPEYFGATNEDTNQWQPTNPTTVKQAVTFGTNGFYLPFSNDALATSFTDSVPHTVQSFTTVETTSWTAPAGVTSVQYLVVGGGGSGGNSAGASNQGGGGGGAGGFRTGTLSVTPEQSYTVIVGGGGPGINYNTSGGARGEDGGVSTFSTISSTGGGGGGTKGGSTSGRGGGSGGGASKNGSGGGGNAGSYSPSEGNPGGSAGQTDNGAGGGGAGGSGTAGGWGGAGGPGESSSITGTATTYAGGGGGGEETSGGGAGSGGSGGGGAGGGASGSTAGTPGTDGLGGGGGGTGSSNTVQSGDGGSGIVILKWADSSGTSSGHPITVVGNTTNKRISNHSATTVGDVHIIGPKVGSSAIYFDGAANLQLPDSAGFAFASGNFTIECWINFTSMTFTRFIHWHQDGNNRGGFQWDPSTGLQWFMESGGSSVIDFNQGASTVKQYMWHHVAIVRNSNTFTIYQDGVAVATTTDSDAMPDYTVGPTIGEGSVVTDGNLTGYMDEIRFSKGVARYTANFTPDTTEFSSDANTSLLIHSNAAMGNTTFTDSSSAGLTITNTDTVHVAQKIGVGMAAFDGTGDYLTVPDGPEFDYTGPFTLEWWFFSRDVSVENTMYLKRAAETASNIRIGVGTNSGKLQLLISSTGSSWDIVIDQNISSISNDTWYHLALTWDGATYTLWLDGTAVKTVSSSTASEITTAAITLGARQDGGEAMNGYMDEIRISRVCRYTSTFTPSTTAFKDDKDTVLLLHMDGGGGIDPTTNLPTLPGQGAYFWDASTNAIFYGADGIPTNKSMINVGGGTNYLKVPASSDWDFGTGEFTLEMLMNTDSVWPGDESGLMANHNGTGWQWILDGENSNSTCKFDFWATDQTEYNSSAFTINAGTWQHLAVTRQSDTLRFYSDGVEVSNTAFTETMGDTACELVAFAYRDNGAGAIRSGNFDQIRVSNNCRYPDGTTFTPSTIPFTSDANTKLLIQSDFSEGGLGADHSNNYNYFTPTNLTVGDSMPDSPMNNFCTWNPIAYYYAITTGTLAGNTYSEGNLKVASTVGSGANWTPAIGTLSVSSGKWYWEYNFISNTGNSTAIVGVMNAFTTVYANPPTTTGYRGSNGNKYIDWVVTSYGDALVAGDIIGLALDLDAETITFYRNNVSQGAISLGAQTKASGSLTPTIAMGDTSVWTANFGQDSSFAGAETAQGNQDANDRGDFYYAPPANHLALCTDNLSDPLISGVQTSEHFNTVLYTGDGQTTKAITGVGFQPDFTWLKQRSSTGWYVMSDAVRGATKRVASNSGNIEATDVTYIASFGSDGITVGNNSDVNANEATYVTWNWKASGAGSANTDGSINSTVSANTTAGFSVVTYTGQDNAGDTVGHGLSQAPDMIIIKDLTTAEDWQGYDITGGPTKYIQLNDTGGYATDTTRWNDTAPTATVFSLGTSDKVNDAGDEYVAYCFHSVEGYSKVGSYIGNLNADGPFAYTGFSPAWIMFKPDAAADWTVCDNKRNTYNAIADKTLNPNLNSGEHDGGMDFDFVSNGFKIRNANSDNNHNVSILYLAFAESPFKTSNAR